MQNTVAETYKAIEADDVPAFSHILENFGPDMQLRALSLVTSHGAPKCFDWCLQHKLAEVEAIFREHVYQGRDDAYNHAPKCMERTVGELLDYVRSTRRIEREMWRKIREDTGNLGG